MYLLSAAGYRSLQLSFFDTGCLFGKFCVADLISIIHPRVLLPMPGATVVIRYQKLATMVPALYAWSHGVTAIAPDLLPVFHPLPGYPRRLTGIQIALS